jgi:4'-phosphopantetheinyl transferase EntD
MRVVENRGVEMEIDYLQEMERMDELREENRELNALLIASKEALFKAEGREAELVNRVSQMERDFGSQL